MKTTIKDVAKHAGVSFKTVSRVINKENGVAKDKIEKVEAAIMALNYLPNQNARRLRGKSTNIGFMYDNPNSNYVITMLHGILAKCRERNYELIVHPCQSADKSAYDEIILTVQRSMIAGVILTPPMSEDSVLLEQLDKANIKFVRIISSATPPQDIERTIYVNDRLAAYQITEHLIKMNHKKIAFFNGDIEHKSSVERLKGYQSALQDHGIELNPKWVLEGRYSFESGMARAKDMLAYSEVPTAIFACNDEIAAGALFAARMVGVDVPAQLSIAGFEDSPFSRQTWPSLTTAKQPNDLIAGHAAETLIDMVSSRPADEPIEHDHGYLPEVLVRQSVIELPA
ncbi:MAG: LacI family DNA-binding transcriptional regulator [Arenicellales bacterium]